MSASSEYLDDLHFDLSRPYLITPRGNQFYLGIQDGPNRVYYAKPIRTKSQEFAKFQKSFRHAERQSKKQLKSLRTVFGGEFANTAF